MNILILTPDAVGSTLIQRLITIYCQFHQFNQPVINIHELSNGLSKFWSDDFNQELITKKDTWDTYQTLNEIKELLKSTNHYKIARLAKYHINRRKDSLADQIPFYNYLDENFYIIACRRKNLFEHALSLGLTKIVKKLNVYSAYEKIDLFFDMYKDPVNIQPEIIIGILDTYKEYLSWSEEYFNIGTYFEYDRDIQQLEKFILNLPIFSGQKKIGWKETYNMNFDDWNRCHYYGSDLGKLLTNKNQLLLTHQSDLKTDDWSFPIKNFLPIEQQKFIEEHKKDYEKINKDIYKMHQLGIMTSTPPIKKQTLFEKMKIISNFNDLKRVYNIWAKRNPDIASPIDDEYIQQQIERENEHWNAPLLEYKNQQKLLK